MFDGDDAVQGIVTILIAICGGLGAIVGTFICPIIGTIFLGMIGIGVGAIIGFVIALIYEGLKK
jgi:hypothetical protein